MNSENPNRRPLSSRKMMVFHRIAQYLVEFGFTPNQISIASTIFALLSACSFYFSSRGSALWSLNAVVLIQLRLLCNLMDGLMAVEGGLKTKSGELYNDIPDRISDLMIFVGMGMAASSFNFHAQVLGWACGALAIVTAYVRVLGASLGVGHFFIGPMAKQQRMFVASVAGLLNSFEVHKWGTERCLYFALWVILLGSVITVARRVYLISSKLNADGPK